MSDWHCAHKGGAKEGFTRLVGYVRRLYFASSARAITPAARGQAALVPEKVSVHFPPIVVVLYLEYIGYDHKQGMSIH